MISFKIHSPHQTSGWSAPWQTRDYWVAHTLGEEMTSAGGRIVYGDSDIDIYLWGYINEDVNPLHNNILWVIGHPQNILDFLKEKPRIVTSVFRHIFCASKSFCERLRNEFNIDAKYLVLPAPTRPGCTVEYDAEFDIAFVGNADEDKGRRKLLPLLEDSNSVVYGGAWESLLTGTACHGKYIPWCELPNVWNSARIVPYSTYEDMRQGGFVADACLDAMVNSSALVLPDRNSGFEDLGVDAPQWDTEDELRDLVSYYLREASHRQQLSRHQGKAASVFTYNYAARMLLSCF